MKNISLKRSALSWFQDYAADVLGPSEIDVHTDEKGGKTTFTVTLKSSPPVVEENLGAKSSSYVVHENIRLYLDVIEEGFLEVLVYLNLEVGINRFSDACELANYVNTESNTGYVQIFDEDGSLVIRVKVVSSAFATPSNQDFYYLFASALSVAYKTFDLFYLFSSSDLDPDSVIELLESKVSNDSFSDSSDAGNSAVSDSDENSLHEDKEIRVEIVQFSNEFKNVVSELDDSSYWGKRLDYSIGSLVLLDQLVKELWHGEPPNQKNIESVVAVFGSYIAQILMQTFNGRWAVGSDGAWKYIMALSEDHPEIQVYPFVWMRKRFEKGELISEKYESLIAYSEKISKSYVSNAVTKSVTREISIDDLSNLLDLSVKGPSTDSKAKPTVVCTVMNQEVVLIKEGAIRGTLITNSFFLLAEKAAHPRRDSGQRIAVKCYWYNWKPKTSWMGIHVKEGAYEIIENYSGEVVVNFGRGD